MLRGALKEHEGLFRIWCLVLGIYPNPLLTPLIPLKPLHSG